MRQIVALTPESCARLLKRISNEFVPLARISFAFPVLMPIGISLTSAAQTNSAILLVLALVPTTFFLWRSKSHMLTTARVAAIWTIGLAMAVALSLRDLSSTN